MKIVLSIYDAVIRRLNQTEHIYDNRYIRILAVFHPVCAENMILMIIMLELSTRQIETFTRGASFSARISGNPSRSNGQC